MYNVELQNSKGNFGFVSKFFTYGFSTVTKTVNKRHLMLRISVICKLAQMRNNGLYKTTDR